MSCGGVDPRASDRHSGRRRVVPRRQPGCGNRLLAQDAAAPQARYRQPGYAPLSTSAGVRSLLAWLADALSASPYVVPRPWVLTHQIGALPAASGPAPVPATA